MKNRHGLPQGTFAHILVILLSVILSVALFFGAAFGVIFHAMYEKGGHMLAALLLSYDITEFIPGLYFSAEEVEQIRTTYLAPQAEDTEAAETEPALALADAQPSAAPAEGEAGNVSWTDGIAVITAPTATPMPTPEPTVAAEAPAEEVPADEPPAPTEEPLENPMEYVLIGRVDSENNVYLRNTPSLTGEGVNRVAPGTWVRIVGESGSFYKIVYEGKEYYIFNTTLHVVKVPVESAGASEE